MKRSLPFTLAAAAIVTSGLVLFWPFLAAEGRKALALAGVLVFATQVPLHLLLASWRSRNDRFVAAVVWGFASRLALIVVAIALLVVPGRVEPAVFLLSLGGFLVAVLLAESLLEQRNLSGAGHAKASGTV